MRKIKVLVVPSDRTGVGYFRSTKPHIFLEEKYPDEFLTVVISCRNILRPRGSENCDAKYAIAAL
jgi:hypothetical protein